MRLFLLALACLLGPALVAAKEKPANSYAIRLPPKPDFSGLDWMLGEWQGKTTGRSPEGEVRLSVAYDLDRRFIVFREGVSLPRTATAPATNEAWMGILSASPADKTFFLRSFSSTGFITSYRVTVDGGEIRFNPEGGELPPPGWLFRRVVRRAGPGEFSETVQAAPPDKPFFDYYTAKLTRIVATEKPGAAVANGNSKKE